MSDSKQKPFFSKREQAKTFKMGNSFGGTDRVTFGRNAEVTKSLNIDRRSSTVDATATSSKDTTMHDRLKEHTNLLTREKNPSIIHSRNYKSRNVNMSADYTTGMMSKMKESMISSDLKFATDALNTRRSADPGSKVSFTGSSELAD